MTTAISSTPTQREPELLGQTVVVIGASAGSWPSRSPATSPARSGPAATLLLIGGTGGRRIGLGLGILPAVTAAMPALTASLALELAPVRARRSHHEQHGLDRRDVRHRRRPTVHLVINEGGDDGISRRI